MWSESESEPWKEREKALAPKHAEHVPKLELAPIRMLLENVGENLATLDDAAIEYHEVLSNKSDRRLLGMSAAGVDRDANVAARNAGESLIRLP